MDLPYNIVKFLKDQHFVIVSTLDANGGIHCSAKGIIDITENGEICIADLYLRRTFENVKRNPRISITAVDEAKFLGYTLQGKAEIINREDVDEEILEKWEDIIVKRISTRVIGNVQSKSSKNAHFESSMPLHPEYLIKVDVENIIDLRPPKPEEQDS